MKKQLSKNGIVNLTYFLINAGVGIWMVPYLIDKLGVELYGLLPLAISLTAYINLISISLNSSISYFLSKDFGRDDKESADKTFNTALFGVMAIVFISFPMIATFSFNVEDILSIPSGSSAQVAIFFMCILSGFLISLFKIIFSSSPFCHNRLDLITIVQAIELAVRVGLLILLFSIYPSNLVGVGWAYFGASIVSLVVSVIIWKGITPFLTINYKKVDITRIKSMFSMSQWVLINQVGSLFMISSDILIVNRFVGSEAAGKYAIAYQLVLIIRSLSGLISGLLTPIIFSLQAKGNRSHTTRVIFSGIKYNGILISVPVGLLCGLAEPILSIWLGSEYIVLAPLVWILVGHLAVNSSVRPLFSLQQAANQVRLPGLITLILGIANIAVGLILTWGLGLGIYSIAASGVFFITAKNVIFTTWHASKILDISISMIIRELILAFVSTGVVTGLSYFMAIWVGIDYWYDLIIVIVVVLLISSIFIWKLILSKSDRKDIKQFFSIQQVQL